MNLTKRNIWNLFLVSILVISGCNLWYSSKFGINLDGEWQNEGLNEFFVYEIQLHEGLVYAGTNKGIFRKEVQGQNWEYLGPVHTDSALVPAFVIFSSNEILASTYFGRNRDSDASSIARTINGGETWESYSNGFGGKYEGTPLLMEKHSGSDIIFARLLYNVARSTDKGKSWVSVFGSWDSIGAAFYLNVDQDYPNAIWAGGANALGQSDLVRSYDGGDTWERLEIGKYEAPVYGALMHPTQKEHIVIGLSSSFSKHSGIQKSNDDGQSWRTTFSKDGWGILALEKSPRDGSIIYASGYNHSDFKQRTVWFAASSNFGDTWQVVSNLKNPTSTNVRDLAILQMGDSEIIYMATGLGVYSYRIDNILE